MLSNPLTQLDYAEVHVYRRVSTGSQDLERQDHMLKYPIQPYPDALMHADKGYSGSDRTRPSLHQMTGFLNIPSRNTMFTCGSPANPSSFASKMQWTKTCECCTHSSEPWLKTNCNASASEQSSPWPQRKPKAKRWAVHATHLLTWISTNTTSKVFLHGSHHRS